MPDNKSSSVVFVAIWELTIVKIGEVQVKVAYHLP